MPPSLSDRLLHILSAIEEIQAILADIDKGSFAEDRLRLLSVERLLEIVSEASRHLPAEVRTDAELPWRAIADLGNLLRHAYHTVDVDALWYIAKDDLPPLKAAVERLLTAERRRQSP